MHSNNSDNKSKNGGYGHREKLMGSKLSKRKSYSFIMTRGQKETNFDTDRENMTKYAMDPGIYFLMKTNK